MARTKIRIAAAIIAAIILAGAGSLARVQRVLAQSKPSEDAADVYWRAAKLITVDSPSNSNNITYPNYPPFNEDWMRLAKDAWEKNRPARELARQARNINQATWPNRTKVLNLDQNAYRSLARELGDAALYVQVRGDDTEAIEEIRDLLHLADVLQENSPFECVMDGASCQAMAANRTMVVSSDVVLTTDPNDAHDLRVSEARKLIQQLFTQRSLKDQINDAAALENPLVWIFPQLGRPALKKIFHVLEQVNAERSLAAMSLACHVFRFEKGRWPQSLNELVPAYVEKIPVDPWGNGKETLGYALIKGGLPDGSDRPLVYSRMESPDGLFYRLDRPEYAYYVDDGTHNPVRLQKHGGQFRDVARWAPPAGGLGGPTTRALVP